LLHQVPKEQEPVLLCHRPARAWLRPYRLRSLKREASRE
jgi:hypothetical protein